MLFATAKAIDCRKSFALLTRGPTGPGAMD
jgi:hypothetical protein